MRRTSPRPGRACSDVRGSCALACRIICLWLRDEMQIYSPVQQTQLGLKCLCRFRRTICFWRLSCRLSGMCVPRTIMRDRLPCAVRASPTTIFLAVCLLLFTMALKVCRASPGFWCNDSAPFLTIPHYWRWRSTFERSGRAALEPLVR